MIITRNLEIGTTLVAFSMKVLGMSPPRKKNAREFKYLNKNVTYIEAKQNL